MSQALAPQGEAILKCENIWKFFDDGSKAFAQDLTKCGNDVERLAAAGRFPAAVRAAELSLARGEVLVLMGLSGSGKSTLLRCMTRLITPSSGRVLLDGTDMGAMDSAALMRARREKMGMVFQNYGLMPHLNALQNVMFPMRVQGVGLAERERRAREMLALVGLEGREAHYPHELSGGQQQRVGIARSLTLKPDIWFLDEPFSALDPLVRKEMKDEVLRLRSVMKTSIVFVTHDFSEAIRLADRIAIMKQGEIVQLSTAEELISSPANEYVAKFTRDIRKSQVLTASKIMTPVNGLRPDTALSVRADEKLAAIAHKVIGCESPVAVLDGQGALLGEICPQAVLALLLEDAAG